MIRKIFPGYQNANLRSMISPRQIVQKGAICEGNNLCRNNTKFQLLPLKKYTELFSKSQDSLNRIKKNDI